MNVRSNYYALFLYSLGLLIAISFVTKHSNASKTSHYGFMIASTLSTRENITKKYMGQFPSQIDSRSIRCISL